MLGDLTCQTEGWEEGMMKPVNVGGGSVDMSAGEKVESVGGGEGDDGWEINRTCLRKGGWWEKREVAIGVASLAMRAEFSDVLPHPMPVAELLKEL